MSIEIGYYPGCALHGSSNDYERSVKACLGALGAGLKELDDWICCGATAAHAINASLSTALPARNLGLAERDGIGQMLAPCPMCSMELIKAGRSLAQSEKLRKEISEIVELKDSIFYADLLIGDSVRVSARPSDAIALALRVGAPVRCAERVLDEAGIIIPDEQEDEVEKFREFLEQVRPEDFAS